MTFEQEWFPTYECIASWRMYMGDDTILEGIAKRNIEVTMQVRNKVWPTIIIQILHFQK
jgi:hypothetical protein